APVVSAHTSRGIDFLERFGQFAKERALIEEEYAAKLKSLAKRSRGKKNEDDESKMYSTTMAFLTMLDEIESLASQHEVVGERLRNDLCPKLVEKCRQLRTMRKKQFQYFEMMEKHLQARVDELAKQKKNYEKAHLDAQGAHVKGAKADKNMNLSRIELEKAKTNANTKNAICEQSKQNYAAQLGATNQAKFEHYNVILPKVLEVMRQLDVERIEFSKKAMLECVAAETSVLNIIQRCYSDMNMAIGTINPNSDTLAVVEQTKTGFVHPLDFQFEDLGDPADILQDGTESFDGSTLKRQPGQGKGANGKGGGGVPRRRTLLISKFTNGSAGTHGGGSGGGTCGVNTGSEYGTLPPQQRCRKIQQKLEELEAELNIKDQSQAGMKRMHVAYTQNPQLGAPAKVAEQLLQNQQEMHTLQTQIQRFKELLQSAQGELNQPLGGNPHQHQAAQQQMYNATTTSLSSPGSSPRGSTGNVAGKLKNGQQHHRGGRFNGGGTQMGSAEQHRASSYSEVSSISSADGLVMSSASSFNSGSDASSTAARTTSGTIYAQLPPMSAHPQQHQQMNGINGGADGGVLHQSASGTTLSSNGAANCAPAVAPPNNTDSDDFYEECDTPAAAASNGCPVPQQQSDMVLGTASALYAYDATPDEVGGTTISMKDGDELSLLERDVGDGWTRVRHVHSNAEGFVPTSYLDCAMGVTWVFESQRSEKALELLFEQAGATLQGQPKSFKVDCLWYKPQSQIAAQISGFFVLHHSHFPDSSFIINANRSADGTAPSTAGRPSPVPPRATADRGFELQLDKFHNAGLVTDPTRYEVTGNEYRLKDFRIRVGTVATAGATVSVKGVVVEIEYAASNIVHQCRGLLEEIVEFFFGRPKVPEPDVFRRNSEQPDNYMAIDTLSQYLDIFSAIRKRSF
uniref:Mediator of RNA polymerase II transcription subunit 20 n=1 Tax=Globodera pallida TaxID=36090 RepID=A0A183BYN5_GLOPA